MTNPDFFSLFLFCFMLFNALPPCILHVFSVPLSPVALVGCFLCLVPPVPAGSPGVWVDSVQCQTAGPEAEWYLSTLSSPPAPIRLRLWWVPLILLPCGCGPLLCLRDSAQTFLTFLSLLPSLLSYKVALLFLPSSSSSLSCLP